MYYIGLDIASEKHDCCILNERKKTVQSFSFPNSSDGFGSLLAALAELPSDEIKIGLEATGIYSENLSVFLRRKGFDVTTINPLLIKKHQSATTLRKTKTDKADAKGIALFIAEEGFQPDLPISYHNQELKSLTRARFSAVQDRSALKNKVKRLRCVQLRKHSKAREKRYSFGYAVSFIFACYQILWTFPKSRYLCSRYLPLVCG